MQQLNSEKIEKLIELVKVKTAIYDKREKLYKNTEWRDNAWKEIAEKLEADEKICRVAWRSLRDQFSKSIKQLKGRSGQEANLDDKKQYKFFNNLLFLKDSCEPRKTSCNFRITESTLREDGNDDDTTFWREVDDFSIRTNNQTTSIQHSITDDEALMSPPPIPTLYADNTAGQSSSNHSCSSSTPSKRRKVDNSDEHYVNFLKSLLEKTRTRWCGYIFFSLVS